MAPASKVYALVFILVLEAAVSAVGFIQPDPRLLSILLLKQ